MQALLDLIPVVAFFAAFKLAGIYVATGVLIAATLVQVLVQWLTTRRVSKMLLVSAGLVLVFGGLTLWIHDDRFIIWKPTVVYALFGTAMLASQWLSDKPLMEHLLGHQLKADARTWRITNLAWAALWFVLAAVNAFVVVRFSRDAWVNWHTAATPIVFLFGAAQGLWLVRRAQIVEVKEPGKP